MGLKLLNAKLKKEIAKRKIELEPPLGRIEIRHYKNRVAEPEPHTLYIYTSKA